MDPRTEALLSKQPLQERWEEQENGVSGVQALEAEFQERLLTDRGRELVKNAVTRRVQKPES
jgi:hypothetical protein